MKTNEESTNDPINNLLQNLEKQEPEAAVEYTTAECCEDMECNYPEAKYTEECCEAEEPMDPEDNYACDCGVETYDLPTTFVVHMGTSHVEVKAQKYEHTGNHFIFWLNGKDDQFIRSNEVSGITRSCLGDTEPMNTKSVLNDSWDGQQWTSDDTCGAKEACDKITSGAQLGISGGCASN